MTSSQKLQDAIQNRDAARAEFNAATTSKARREADENLNFWIGKVAALSAMAERGM